MVAVVNTWQNTQQTSTVTTPAPTPAAQSCVVPVANSGAVGNWLFALAAWASGGQYDTTVAVGDDAGNYWEPLGAPGGTSPSVGISQCSLWYARNPRPASNIFVSPDGFASAIACLTAEMSGLSPWATLAGITTGFANGATTLPTLNGAIPPASTPLNQNTLTGPSISPWGGSFGGITAPSNAWGKECDWSLQLTTNGTTGFSQASSELIPVTALTEYSASFWAICPQGFGPGAKIGINWYDNTRTFLTNNFSPVFQTPAGQAVFFRASAQAPSGAAFGQFLIQINGTLPATSAFYLSNAVFGVPAQALLFTLGANDAFQTLTGPGAGWTALPFVETPPGQFLGQLTMNSAWQVTSSAVTAAWSVASAADLCGLLGGVLITGLTPTPAAADWPMIQAQAAFGSGATTPWDQQTWTGMTPRFQGLTVGRGRQYELDQIQSGTGTWTWRNNDGALMPGLSSSVYSPYVTAYTPTRLLVTWPPPPNANSRTYVVNRSLMERWPTKLTSARYQQTPSVSTDVWSITTALLQNIARAEILQDNPYAYFPCDDPVGNPYASNHASANTNPLQVVQSKYGPGVAQQQFGVTASELVGDGSTSTWQQSALGTTNQGYSLYYFDPNLPVIVGSGQVGVTISSWFNVLPVTGQPGSNLALITVRMAQATAIQVYIPQSGAQAGQLLVQMPTLTGAGSTFLLSSLDYAASTWFNVTVVIAAGGTSASFYVNGNFTFTLTVSVPLRSPWWFDLNGACDRLGAGLSWNGQVGHVAVVPGQLPAARIASQYLAMLYALYGVDTTGQRIERLLLAGNAAMPRCIPPGTNTCVGATDIGGNSSGQNVVNIAESDNSVLSVNGAGYLTSLQRLDSYNLPISWYFGEDPAVSVNQNPYFALGSTHWFALGGAVTPASKSWLPWLPGNQASLLFTPNGVQVSPALYSGTNVNTADFPVTPGTSYTASVWMMAPNGVPATHTGFIALQFFDGVGAPIAGAGGGMNIPLSPGVPGQGVATAQAPAAAVTGQVSAGVGGTPTSGQPFYVAAFPVTTTYTEQPYGPDFQSDYDPTQVFNDVTLTQLATPAYFSYAYSAVTSGSMFTAVGSSFIAGQQVVLSGGTIPAGFIAGAIYYVVNLAGQSFQLSATSGGAPIPVTSNGNGTMTGVTAATGVTVAVRSAASILQYGDQTVQEDVYLSDPNALTDLAYWILNTLGTPDVHITQLTLDPSANPALWPVVLGIESGQVVWVNRRLGGTNPEISGYFQVMTVSHTVGERSWQTQLALLPYYGNILTLDDPQFGILLGNPLGW